METCALLLLVSVLVIGVYARENSSPCIICPNGAGLVNEPLALLGDHMTCAEFIEEATTVEAGADECRYIEFYEAYCFNEPVDHCSVCPNGVTVAGDHIAQIGMT